MGHCHHKLEVRRDDNFRTLLVRGEVKLSQLQDYIDYWYEHREIKWDLITFLGFTDSEYWLWVNGKLDFAKMKRKQ